jgi:hypothetical protein
MIFKLKYFLISFVALLVITLYSSISLYNTYSYNFPRIYTEGFTDILESVKVYSQRELAKGAMLSDLNKLQFYIEDFSKVEKFIKSIDVFEQNSGIVLFSTDSSKIGKRVNVLILDKNRNNKKEYWNKKSSDFQIYGKSLEDAIGKNVGAVVINVSNEGVDSISKVIRKDIFINALKQVFFLFLLLLSLFFAFSFGQKYSVLEDEKIAAEKNWIKKVKILFSDVERLKKFFDKTFFIRMISMFLFLFFVSTIFSSQNKLRQQLDVYFSVISKAKLKISATILGKNISEAISYGVELESLPKAESYLQGFAKKNSEISYILITDEVGRVLYEMGDAKKAFITDEKTGQVKQSPEFYNMVLPIKKAGEKATGWLNVGTLKRFGG